MNENLNLCNNLQPFTITRSHLLFPLPNTPTRLQRRLKADITPLVFHMKLNFAKILVQKLTELNSISQADFYGKFSANNGKYLADPSLDAASLLCKG